MSAPRRLSDYGTPTVEEPYPLMEILYFSFFRHFGAMLSGKRDIVTKLSLRTGHITNLPNQLLHFLLFPVMGQNKLFIYLQINYFISLQIWSPRLQPSLACAVIFVWFHCECLCRFLSGSSGLCSLSVF